MQRFLIKNTKQKKPWCLGKGTGWRVNGAELRSSTGTSMELELMSALVCAQFPSCLCWGEAFRGTFPVPQSSVCPGTASQSPAASLWWGVLVCWDAEKIGETVHTGEVCSLWRWGWCESWKSLIEEHQDRDLCRCVLRLCIPSQDNCSPGVWSERVGPVTLHTSPAVHFHSSSLHRNPSPEPGVTPHSSQSLCYLMGITKGRNST